MENNLKYSVGVDMSKESFDACISVINTLQKVTIKASRKFANSLKGFHEFKTWIKKHQKEQLPLVITVEATGVYYEEFAINLFESSFCISVVLPNKSKKYLQSKGLKSKNDKIDAKGLSQMGAEQNLTRWEPFSKSIYELRSLTRQNEDLQNQKTMVINRLEANKYSAFPDKLVKKQLNKLLQFYEKQIMEVKSKIGEVINNDELLKSKVEKINKIKGLGILTIATIIAETNGFKLFNNQRQVVSYAGYDVIENQSGNRAGKTRISKKGNSHIRRALHMPAFLVVRYDQGGFKALYERIEERTGFKMKAYVAVQRKLLMLIYTLWKKNEEFDPVYHKKQGITFGNEESKSFFSLNSEGIKKKIGGIKPPKQDKLPCKVSPEAFFSLMQN